MQERRKEERNKKERKKERKKKNYLVSIMNSSKNLSKHMLHQDLFMINLKKMKEEEKRKKTKVVSHVLVSFACIYSYWNKIHASISL